MGRPLAIYLLTAQLTMMSVVGCTAVNENPARRLGEGEAGCGESWSLAFEEDFSDASYEDRWFLDGFADLSLEGEGGTRHLRIKIRPSADNPKNFQSVLWCREKFLGDLRFRFRAKGESGNASIFYFNANPTKDSGYDSIFDWVRPDAQMARYAGSGKMEMYSVGLLRNTAKCNFRYIGGGTVHAYNRPNRQQDRAYDKATLICSYDSPFEGKPDTWFEFDLQIVGNRITLEVDGEKVLDVQDNGKTEPGVFSRMPLTRGGFFGFRNFKPSAVCVDYIKVYRRQR